MAYAASLLGGGGGSHFSFNAAPAPSSSSLPTPTPTPAPIFVRAESIQCVAQSIPSIMSAIPQTLAPAAGAAGGSTGNLSTAPHTSTTLSPLTPLSHSSAVYLSSCVESRLRELIRSSLAFMSHSQRRVLATEDVALALRHKGAQPIWGYDNAAAGMTNATTGVAAAAMSSGASGAAAEALAFGQAGDELFLLSDPLIQFDDLLSAPLPAAPADSTFSIHWLAVDGVQPLIPENPPLETPDQVNTTASTMTGQGQGQTTSTMVMGQEKEVEVVTKQPIKHVLSKEQTLYYEYVTSALRGNDPTLKKAVFKSLSEDDGLYQLLPYFTQFIAEEVSRNLHNLTLLTALMRMANCIIFSKYLHIDPYLHQLMPPILTCIVGKQLCLEPFEEHWGLRDYASDMLQNVCLRHGHSYPTLQPRVSKTLVMAWMDTNKSLNTHYGCILALRKLGPLVTKKLILPYIKTYFEQLHPALNSLNEATKMEASFVYHALLDAVSIYVRHELDRSTNPGEMASAVQAAMNAATSVSATAMEDVPSVKLEETTEKGASKKRRRVDIPATAAAASSSTGIAAASTLASSVLPDRETLDGIEMLLELFGEALQVQVAAAVKIIQDRLAPTNKIKLLLPKAGGMNAASTFI